ncbi:hypothetical protein [[Actinomadura] parvosata]|nr:hypothetical protein [Nonomuraea sp. ATCC 55076]
MVLLLRATNIEGAGSWRWELTGASQPWDRNVGLDSRADEYQGFHDTYAYLNHSTAAERTFRDDEARIKRLGDWIGNHAYDNELPVLIQDKLVRVQIQQNSTSLLGHAMDLARIGDRWLFDHLAAFVHQSDSSGAKPFAGDKRKADTARVLAWFAEPDPSSPFTLHRERRQLEKVIDDASQVPIELKVLQYGVTRDRLLAVIQEHPHWDVVHIASRGSGDVLPLVTADGRADSIRLDELADLLAPTRSRLKLLALWLNRNSARTIARTLRRLGIGNTDSAGQPNDLPAGSAKICELAWNLARDLDTGVLAFRHPTTDDFAAELTEHFYSGLLNQMNLIDRAFVFAMRLCGGAESSHRSPCSIAAPVLFGAISENEDRRVCRARMAAGHRHEVPGYLPPVPDRLFGHADTLLEASAALLPGSSRSGVLLHERPGSGATTCAKELAYQHRQWFDLVLWWQARPDFEQPREAMLDLIGFWSEELSNYGMKMPDQPTSKRFVHELLRAMAAGKFLLVLDNLDELLDGDTWEDEGFGIFLQRLVSAAGRSRIILVSRRVPADLDTVRMSVVPVGPLKATESALLLRSLPSLRKLIHEDRPMPSFASEAAVTGTTAGPMDTLEAIQRELAGQIHCLAGGRPKLLVAADVLAGQPEFALHARSKPHLLPRVCAALQHDPDSEVWTAFIEIAALLERWAERQADMKDLISRIDGLGDLEAARALAYVLEIEDMSDAERTKLEREGKEKAAVVAGDGTLPESPGGDPVHEGELARGTLRFLATKDATMAKVERAVAMPSSPLRHDPLIVAAVCGLAFLALSRFGFKIRKDEQSGRSYEIEYRPVPDDAMDKLLALIKNFIPQ